MLLCLFVVDEACSGKIFNFFYLSSVEPLGLPSRVAILVAGEVLFFVENLVPKLKADFYYLHYSIALLWIRQCFITLFGRCYRLTVLEEAYNEAKF
jgi:hypothetical protein